MPVLLDVSDAAQLGEVQRSALRRWTLVGGAVSLVGRAERGWTHHTASVPSARRPISTLLSRPIPARPTGRRCLTSTRRSSRRPGLPETSSRTYLVWYAEPFSPSTASALRRRCASCVREGDGHSLPWPGSRSCSRCSLRRLGWVAHAGRAPVRQLSLTHVFLNSVDLFTTNQVALLSPRRMVRRSVRPCRRRIWFRTGRRTRASAASTEFESSGVATAVFDAPLWMTRLVSVAGFPTQGPFMALRGENAITLVNRSSFLLARVLVDPARRRDSNRRPAGGQERALDPGGPAATTAMTAPSLRAAGPPSSQGWSPNTRAKTRNGTIGDCVVCAMGSPTPAVTSDIRDLSFSGSAAVVYHLGTRQASAAESDTR